MVSGCVNQLPCNPNLGWSWIELGWSWVGLSQFYLFIYLETDKKIPTIGSYGSEEVLQVSAYLDIWQEDCDLRTHVNRRQCSCPRQKALVPSSNCPWGTPFHKLNDLIMKYYTASTFGTTQLLTSMEREPMLIHRNPYIEPVQRKKTHTVPYHWKEKVKQGLDRDRKLRIMVTTDHRPLLDVFRDTTVRDRQLEAAELGNKHCCSTGTLVVQLVVTPVFVLIIMLIIKFH